MKRILIDTRGTAVRTALMQDQKLLELFIEEKSGGSWVGRVVLGCVKNILPSQFAFVDIGRDRNAFMNLSAGHTLKVGQPVLVQVCKDETGSKGANVGERLHFNGRLAIIYKSNRCETGVSHKITDPAERERLRAVATRGLPPGYGVIIRTQAEGKTADEIQADITRLISLYEQVTAQARHARPPCVLYQENQWLQEILSDDVAEIWINNPAEMESLCKTVAHIAPGLEKRVQYYDEAGTQRLFDVYGIERQIERALQKKVWLPCGGFITLEQTEACVIVDVNTGKFAGRKNYRDTIWQTNAEAAVCVAEQLALRNLSGMIIVDFIDMDTNDDKQRLLRVFTDAIQRDRVKTTIVGMTELGLVQLTRRKTRAPLSQCLECECPHCQGTGRVRK